MNLNRRLLLSLLCMLSFFTLTVQAGDSIKGQVVDETGKPLEGVTWMISGIEELHDGKWTRVHRTGVPRKDTTDDEGRFVVSFPERLRYDLQFRKSGFAPAFIFEVSADSPEIRLTMKRGERIHGTVKRLIDGQLKPVPMASVELRLPSWDFWYQERVFTGPSGEFEFRAALHHPSRLFPLVIWSETRESRIHHESVSGNWPMEAKSLRLMFAMGNLLR